MAMPLYGEVCLGTYLIPASIGIARFRTLVRPLKILAVLTVLACVEIAIGLTFAAFIRNNYLVSDIYRVVETTMLCAVFYYAVEFGKSKMLAVGGGVFFALFWTLDLLLLRSPLHLDSAASMVSRLVLIVIAAVALYAEFSSSTTTLFERPTFWIGGAVALYSAGTLFLLGLSNQLLSMGVPYFRAGWVFNWSLLIVSNLFYSKALLCKP